MESCPGGGDRINSFALVTYIPDPLGSFLDQLRSDLVPGCFARSHVTILPPRILGVPPGSVFEGLESDLHEFPPFKIELANVEVFESTSVIYLGVGSGSAELRSMHQALNRGRLGFDEPFAYHPHVTLAQDISSTQVPELAGMARNRWAQFASSRGFEVQVLTFVQNTSRNRWEDLKRIPLREPVAVLNRR